MASMVKIRNMNQVDTLFGKTIVKVCIRAKWLNRLDPIPVSTLEV